MDENQYRSFVKNKLFRLQNKMQDLWDQIRSRELEGEGGRIVAGILQQRYDDLERDEETPLLRIVREFE